MILMLDSRIATVDHHIKSARLTRDF